MEYGAQLYTVRDFTQNDEDLKSTLKRIAEIGYKNIQVSAVGNIAPSKIKDIADFYGLKIVITHTNTHRIVDDTVAVIEEHRAMGCNNIGIGSFIFSDESSYYQFIKDYAQAARLIFESGMKLHYHNHAFEFQRFGKRTGFDILMEETDPSLMGFILDTYWVQVGGKNPADLIEKLTGRITCAHFKDLTINENNQCMTEVMEGNLDWGQIIKACERTGVEYALVEQDSNWTVDPFASLETSYHNLMNEGK